MATTTLPGEIAWGYLLSYFSGFAIVFAVGLTIARLVFGGSFARQVIIGFSAAFGNTVLLGIPLVLTSFGDQAGLPLFLLMACHGTVLFTTLTIVLEVSHGGRADLREVTSKAVTGLLTNPILWGMACGIAVNLLDLTLPEPIARWATLMAGAGVPCALFSVGASLRVYKIAGSLMPALMITGLKLVALPLVVWALAATVFDVPPLWAKVVILLAALPVGVNAYLFGARYNAGQAESAAGIVLSSVLSVVTLPFVLYWLGVGG